MGNSLVDLWDAYWAWTGEHGGTVWLCAFALVLLYIAFDNWGQPWMDEDDDTLGPA